MVGRVTVVSASTSLESQSSLQLLLLAVGLSCAPLCNTSCTPLCTPSLLLPLGLVLLLKLPSIRDTLARPGLGGGGGGEQHAVHHSLRHHLLAVVACACEVSGFRL